MEAPLHWGILATGGIAQQFTRDLQRAGLHVEAVGSRSLVSAQAFADTFNLPNAHGSYAALVADPAVDIIYIATPHPQHVEAALLALDAGKHVLVEKPFALNGKEAAKIVTRARAKNLIVLEAMWTRFLPHMQRIHQRIADGTLGQLRSVTADHFQLMPTDPNHRINAIALGGGALLDLGIYPVSFAIDMLGPPTAITAKARMSATGVDAEVIAVMQHAHGTLSTSTAALDSLGKNTATVRGDKARIEIDDVWYTPTSFTVYDMQDNVLERFDAKAEGRGMQLQALEMETLVRDGRSSTVMPPDQSIQIMQALDTIRQQIGLVYPGE